MSNYDAYMEGWNSGLIHGITSTILVALFLLFVVYRIATRKNERDE